MTNSKRKKQAAGFSLIELMIAMTIILVVLGAAMSLFARSLWTRQRESSRTDALTSAQAALNVISREIANSGYGIAGNGLVPADSGLRRLRFRSNVVNTNEVFNDPGEDITYFFDATSQSILRHDPNANPQTSIIINRISEVQFRYFDYVGGSAIPTETMAATSNTGRVRVTVRVSLEEVQQQVNPQDVTLVSDVTLRNADYMLRQY